MLNAYLWLKFIHVTAAIFWVGGLVALAVQNRRHAGPTDGPEAHAPMQDRSLGRLMIRPSMIVAILAGFALAHLSGGMAPWAAWGVIVSIAFLIVTLAFIRRYHREVTDMVLDGHADAARAAILRRRIGRLGMLNILLLLSAVWAMVYKPCF